MATSSDQGESGLVNQKPVQQALQAHFKLDARRVEFISHFIIALLKVRSVNLALVRLNCIEQHQAEVRRGEYPFFVAASARVCSARHLLSR